MGRADPGVGREDAPFGSEAWAQRVRLHMQSIVNHVHLQPESLKEYVDIVQKHRAWTLMNKPDGGYFTAWEDFCSAKQPWGLGRPWEELRPFIEAVIGKQAVQLATVAPARPGPGRGNTTEKTGHDVLSLSPAEEKGAARLRAIVRAPEAVQDLYREGLIGQVDAAKLGPKNPEPAEAARVVEVTREAVAVAKAESPKTDADKKRVQRKVNAKVREMTASPRTTSKLEVVWTAVASLPRDEQRALHTRLGRALEMQP